MKHQFGIVVCACAFLLTCNGALHAQPARPAVQPEGNVDASKGNGDVDLTIAYPMAKVLDAAKQALAAYGCNVKNEKPDYLECTRDRHVGVMVGSGGEKITVQLIAKSSETRVEVKTGKGFVGRLGKRNWSTPVFEEMMKTLKGS
jgi:hypothetical protein